MGKIVSLFLASCFFCFPLWSYKSEHPIYTQYADEIIRTMTQKAEKELGLVCISTGGGMPNDVEIIELDFVKKGKGTIDKGRELEIKATELLVNIINNHDKIRPYLREYPVSPSRADVSISFEKKDGSERTDGSVVYVLHAKEKIFYQRKDPKSGNLETIMSEPYTEAFEKVMGKRSKD